MALFNPSRQSRSVNDATKALLRLRITVGDGAKVVTTFGYCQAGRTLDEFRFPKMELSQSSGRECNEKRAFDFESPFWQNRIFIRSPC